MMTESPQREIKKVEELIAEFNALLDRLEEQMPFIRDYYDDVTRRGEDNRDRPRAGADGRSEVPGDGDQRPST